MLISFALSAQTPISGIINDYSKVTYVDVPCNYVTASNPEYFAVGDRVLIIQMKGATIDASNSASYGNVTAIGDAGNYEFNEVVYIDVNKLHMKRTMRTYTTAGLVQVIKVPQYVDVEVTGTLKAKAWDGNVGGVLVFEASGFVTLNADIDVSGLGFLGGLASDNSSSSCFSNTSYSLAQPSTGGGQKGEGITVITTANGAGKGKLANGGGGGNNHNTGGAGGSNYGAGGNGGSRASTTNTGQSGCTSSGCAIYSSNPGIGGLALGTHYASNKIFLGGGGGGGQQNNNTSFDGANGGGIVIIRAGTIYNLNGSSILAKGGTVYETDGSGNILPPNSVDIGDGNSGAGGGGVIFLNVGTILNAVSLNASGGKGGDTNDFATAYNCRYFGPGGGGGGGAIILNAPDAFYDPHVEGGASGVSHSHGSSYGAVAGSNGSVITGTTPVENGNFNFPGTCGLPLPISLLNFSAVASGSSVDINWTILSDDEVYFILERSADANEFQQVATVSASSSNHYFYTDLMPYSGTSYYRLSYVNREGRRIQLGVRRVNLINASHQLSLVPNPATTEVFVEGLDETATIKLFTLSGQEVFASVLNAGESFSVVGITTGMYVLSITSTSISETHRLVVE